MYVHSVVGTERYTTSTTNMYNKDVTYLPFGRILLKPMDAFQPVLDEFSPGHLLQHRQLRRQPRGIRLHVVQQLVGIGRQLHHLEVKSKQGLVLIILVYLNIKSK
jgi:hypothetical protein